MNGNDSQRDQRKSFRCRVAESRRQCALRIGADTVPGWLIDESAGGFSVLVDRLAGLETGQTVLLQTDSGCFRVLVMYIAEAPPPEDVALDSEEPNQWFRLGLKRLGDALPSDEPPIPLFAGSLRFKMRDWTRSNRTMSAFGVLMGMAVMTIPLLLIGLYLYARQSKVGAVAEQNDFPLSWSADGSGDGQLPTMPPPIEGFAATDRSLPVSPADRTEKPITFGMNSERDLLNTIRRMPGATPLVLPDVIRRLRLTKKQQKLIQQIVDAMAESIRQLDLDPRVHGAERHQITQLRNELLEDYLRRALDVLTPKQREKWQELLGEPADRDK